MRTRFHWTIVSSRLCDPHPGASVPVVPLLFVGGDPATGCRSANKLAVTTGQAALTRGSHGQGNSIPLYNGGTGNGSGSLLANVTMVLLRSVAPRAAFQSAQALRAGTL